MAFWHNCLSDLAKELPGQQMDLWVRPLEIVENKDGSLKLLAPNWSALRWVKEKYKSRIEQLASDFYGRQVLVTFGLKNSESGVPAHTAAHGLANSHKTAPVLSVPPVAPPHISQRPPDSPTASRSPRFVIQPSPDALSADRATTAPMDLSNHEKSRLNNRFTFDNLVTGRANDLAQAAAMQVAAQPGSSYNPLFIYGGVGLGKTHLLHAVGNYVFHNQPNLVVRYVHSEDYVADVVRACRMKSFDDFKNFYRSIDVLLIDDIQFFEGKDRTQEEFFFLFNALLDSKRQVIITCDTYPKDIQGLENRLISRLDWGLTVQIEPPELEMRIAILHEKAEAELISLPDDAAFLIAKNLRSNVRELEGALKKVTAYANFHNAPITIEVCRNALRDIFHANRRQVTVEIIKKTVADYFKISINDMHSANRSRNRARPRQIAMWLAKELTVMSLPSIGEAFGGRDHTTVLHAHRLISKLRQNDPHLNQDLHLLTQTLQG